MRDSLNWSKYINEALYRFGQQAEVLFGTTTGLAGGTTACRRSSAPRDLYAHFNNQVLHLADQGLASTRIHNVYDLPKSLQQKWECQGYQAPCSTNARGVVNRYLGFWDCNPATLIPLSPDESAPLYVEMMGGTEKILSKVANSTTRERTCPPQEILNKLVQAEPSNREAKDLVADVSSRSATSRRTPACSTASSPCLRTTFGIPEGASPKSSGPDVYRDEDRAVPRLPGHPRPAARPRGCGSPST